MAVVSGHQSPDYRPINLRYQEQAIFESLLAGDVKMGIVPAPPQAALQPQRDDLSFVGPVERPDLRYGSQAQTFVTVATGSDPSEGVPG